MWIASCRQKLRKAFIVTVKHIFISAHIKTRNNLGPDQNRNIRIESMTYAKGNWVEGSKQQIVGTFSLLFVREAVLRLSVGGIVDRL